MVTAELSFCTVAFIDSHRLKRDCPQNENYLFDSTTTHLRTTSQPTMEKFMTIALHETRELRVRTLTEKIQIILSKKRFDDCGDLWGSGSSEISISPDDFQSLTQLNWSRIFFCMLGSCHVPREDIVDQTNEDSGLVSDSRFTTVILSKKS